MTTVIIGSEGNVAQRLRPLFQDIVGIDRAPGAAFVVDLADIDYDQPWIAGLLSRADIVVHLGTSPRVNDPDEVHYQSLRNTVNLLTACQKRPVPKVLLPSSHWAEPPEGFPGTNTYAASKRVIEGLAEMYRVSTGQHCVALRFGWVARDAAKVATVEDWLKAAIWDDARLLREVAQALQLDRM